LDGSLVALELELDPAPVVPLEGGVLLEPPAALPEGEVSVVPLAEPLAEPLVEPLVVEPPPAESFFAGSEDGDAGLEDEGGELGVVLLPEAEPEAEPDGELGLVVAEPEDAPEPGAARRSPALSPQAVSMPAPSAMEIATAKAESLIL
jgi:hypothetical protein